MYEYGRKKCRLGVWISNASWRLWHRHAKEFSRSSTTFPFPMLHFQILLYFNFTMIIRFRWFFFFVLNFSNAFHTSISYGDIITCVYDEGVAIAKHNNGDLFRFVHLIRPNALNFGIWYIESIPDNRHASTIYVSHESFISSFSIVWYRIRFRLVSSSDRTIIYWTFSNTNLLYDIVVCRACFVCKKYWC